MTQRCPQCSILNPSDAVYCFRDGSLLPARAGSDVPRDPSKQPFPSPLVLSNGHFCANFDQLAFACQAHWPIVIDALKDGFLQRFFDGIGRSDLALAARDAAKFPDVDRGLDRFLSLLPTNVLEDAKLSVNKTEFRVGPLTVGRDYRIQLGIENTGMRLLYGAIVSDAEWLSPVANGTGFQRLFQCRLETDVPIFINGKKLRAGADPFEAHLAVESNGGTATIRVIAHVPIKPFERGPLSGAETPRRIVEFAQQQPESAAELFENGDVERWYIENGWTYPVRLPSAGARAADEYLKALGLNNAPEVIFEERSVHIQGRVDAMVTHRLRLQTNAQTQLFATGESDQPWLTVAPAELQGHIAYLPLRVESVPNYPGKTLYARVTVRTNGNRQHDVSVSLMIEASNGSVQAPPAAVPVAIRIPPQNAQRPGTVGSSKTLPRAIIVTPELQTAVELDAPMPNPAWPWWKHLIPGLILLLILLVCVFWDWLR